MIKLYFKQSWALIRQNKLFSSLYVLGTGLAIAMTMIIVIVYYVKIAPIYPETNRSQTMVLTSVAVKNTEQHSMTKSSCSYHMLKEWIYPLKNAEEVTAVLGRMLLGNYVQPEDGGNVIPVMVKQTDPAFFRVFPFEFLGGQAFSQADFESGIHNVVLSESGARRILGDTEAVGRTFSLNFEDYRVVGVVRSGSYMLSDSYADVYMPYTCITGYDRGDKMANMVGPYQVFIKLPGADDAPKLRAEIQELVHKFNHSQPDLEIDLNNQPLPYWQYPLKQMGYSEIDWANVFKIHGWLLLAFLFVPAINLGGMISSRMEQRLSEMGIRKAFGANRSVLLGQVLWENLALTCVGGFIGLLLSWGGLVLGCNWIFGLFNSWPVPIPEGVEVNLSPDMLFSPFVFVLAFGTCVLLNLLSAFCPAWYSLRKNIIYSINEKI